MMLTRNLFTPHHSLEEACQQFNVDAKIILALAETRYLNGQDHHVPKAGNMHLSWKYAQDPNDHPRFTNMLHVSPHVFETILSVIEHHPVFTSGTNNGQAHVEDQLAVTLFRMGRYGNGASIQDIACMAGCSEGSVENYTDRCFTAIESLQEIFVRKLTRAEKEKEKQ